MLMKKQFLASYSRLSLADGDMDMEQDGKDESNSIENQKTLIREFVESKDEFEGMEIKEFVDDGYTGTNFERPGFKKMIDLAKQGEIAVIVVKDLSRFGRDYIGVGEYMEQIFPLLGVRFIAINNEYDSKNYVGTTMSLDVAVGNLVNTMYSRDLGKKLHSANEVKWKKGYSTNGLAPFGYVFDTEKKGRYKIDPHAAIIVRKIFDLALLGMNTTQIAYRLNEEKIVIPSEYNKINKVQGKENQYVLSPDKIWNAGKVLRILKEYTYTGAMVLGKRRVILSGTKIVRENPKERRYITEGTHEAIVTHEEFMQAQKVIRYTSRKEYSIKNNFALRRKIRCGHCHRVMYHNFNLTDPVVWCCDGREMPKFSKCPKGVYSIKKIENITFCRLQYMLSILSRIDKKIKEMDREKKQKEGDLAGLKLKEEMKNSLLKEERIILYKKYAYGEITLKEYQSLKEQVNKKIIDVQSAMEDDALKETAEEKILSDVRKLVCNAEDFLKEDTLTQNAVTAFIDAVYIYDGPRVEVRFRLEKQIGQVLDMLNISVEPEK